MKQKKYYKTWKFWITSLLALSASSIITSLTLTSCAANSTVNKDDIVITDQSGGQEFSIDDNKDLTLTVDATSNSGANLRYQWYVNKTTDNSSWQKIKGATSKTYTIPISDIQDIDSQTIWKYKAEIYHENNENLKVESKPIPVKIIPPTGGSVPENPSIPENKPDQPTPNPPTPPSVPDLDPDYPSNPSEPTPPDNPPSKPDTPSSPDNPTIQPSPDHEESKGIGARLPLDKNGIVTTKYDQEKWIGDNSLSLLIEATPNVNKIAKAVNQFKSNSTDPNIKRILDDLVGAIQYEIIRGNNYNQFGTGWILDYSNSSTNGLTDYYIATNMHVMSSYFTFTFDSSRYDSSSDTSINVGVRIPFNKTTVSELDLYISQPKYNTVDQKLNDKSYADKLDSQWYKTNIGIDNWEENLIPIGAYNNQNDKGFEHSQAFDMELTWEYKNNDYNRQKQTLYFKSSSDGKFITQTPQVGNNSYQYDVDDFSVFKIGLQKDAFDKYINNGNENKEMFERMKKLFDTTSGANTQKDASYIKRLNELLKITSNSKAYSETEVDKLFMFGESSNLIKENTQISIGGYPLIQERVPSNESYKYESYTTFNTNTLTGNNIIEYPPDYYHTRDKMGINQYTYKGNLYKIKWKDPNNYILKNVNLLAGSSGGVGIDQNYKLTCINWGKFILIEYYQGIKYVLDSSSSTGLYSSKDKNSLIWKWVTYVNKSSKQTKLAELFNNLQSRGYFK